MGAPLSAGDLGPFDDCRHSEHRPGDARPTLTAVGGGRPQIRLRIAAPAGSGKSTLARLLRDFFHDHDIPVVCPGRMPKRSREDHASCVEALKRRGTIIAISEHDSRDPGSAA